MMTPDPTFQPKWLITIAAAFGLAFILAVGTSGCAGDDPDAQEPRAVDVSGGEVADDDVDSPDMQGDPQIAAPQSDLDGK